MTADTGQNSQKVKVFLVDQNKFFRQGLRLALAKQRNIEVVDEAAIEEGAYELICSLLPEVVLLGVDNPAVFGLQMARRIAQELPGTSVVVLAPNLDDDGMAQAIAAGAAAYATKDIEVAELVGVISDVAAGGLPVKEWLIARPQLLERVIRHFQNLLVKGRAVEVSGSPITDREAEVLTHVACGYGNKQIAHAFGISEQTIKNHMAAILRKMAANDRTHAVVMAMEYGWISTNSNGKTSEGDSLSSEMVT